MEAATSTKDGAKVDVVVEKSARERWAIEIKSSDRVDPIEVARFERLATEIPGASLLFLSQDPLAQQIGRVRCLHWKEGLAELL